jgi:hypothetical protein
MHFATPEQAEIDLAPRLTLAEEGLSRISGQPYSEMYSVEAHAVAGPSLMLSLAPAGEGRPELLLTMLYSSDMLFAICP